MVSMWRILDSMLLTLEKKRGGLVRVHRLFELGDAEAEGLLLPPVGRENGAQQLETVSTHQPLDDLPKCLNLTPFAVNQSRIRRNDRFDAIATVPWPPRSSTIR
jgi:hypothetical protein